MILDSVILDSLMAWAQQQAPLAENCIGKGELIRRRVRLELSAEPRHVSDERFCLLPTLPGENIFARMYLAEPRCEINGLIVITCECGPLAETRIG